MLNFSDISKKVLEKTKNVHFLVIGPDEVKDYSSSFKNVDSPNISFVGVLPHNEIHRYLSVSDIFVLPSFFESTSNALLEAMSSECVVLALDNSSMSEIIKNGYNGYLFDSPIDMVDVILNLMQDENKRKNIAQAARKTVREKFNFEKMVDHYERIVKDATTK